jgi:hypothetical protein
MYRSQDVLNHADYPIFRASHIVSCASDSPVFAASAPEPSLTQPV